VLSCGKLATEWIKYLIAQNYIREELQDSLFAPNPVI
jgi:hypothetical protein